MRKIVVYDTGYGGELFADELEKEFPTASIIRVIDWRNAEKLADHPRNARAIIYTALQPYLGKVDLIVFANYYISATNLRYFKRKFKNQKLIGFTLKPSRMVKGHTTLVLTTGPTSKTIPYISLYWYTRLRTICLDEWPLLIDDGELTDEMFKNDLSLKQPKDFKPKQVFLACGQFSELKPKFREMFGHNVRIVDSFNDTIKETYQALNIRLPKSLY